MTEFAEWIEAALVLFVLVAAFAVVSATNHAADAWDWMKDKMKDEE